MDTLWKSLLLFSIRGLFCQLAPEKDLNGSASALFEYPCYSLRALTARRLNGDNRCRGDPPQ